MLESALVVVMISLVFFGMLQVVLKLNAEQVQQWAAFAGARSRVVGFNDALVEKVWLVGNILNSGAMTAPYQGLTAPAQADVENDLYASEGSFMMTARTAWELRPQFNYEQWSQISDLPGANSFDAYHATSSQNYPLLIAQALPFLAGSFGTTNAVLQTDVILENHFPFYLQFN